MIKLSRCLYESVNKRLSVLDVVDKCITTDYEVRQDSKEWMRLNPCPLTGSTKDAFAIHELEDGFQMYQIWSHNFLDDRYADLPDSGTAAHLVQALFGSELEVLKFLQGQPPKIAIFQSSNLNPKQKVKPHQDPWKLGLRQRQYRKDVVWHLHYLREVRGLSDATIEHFEIGYDENRCIFTYPYYEDGHLAHFKFKNRDRTNQLGSNSGGDYLFNSRGLANAQILYVEGEHDVCSIWQRYGIEAVGISGSFGEKSAKYRKVIAASKDKDVFLCFDSDDAGHKFTVNFQQWLTGVAKSISVVEHTGEGKDPDEWIRSGGDLLFPEHFVDLGKLF